MTDQEQRDLRGYCAFLLSEYGFHISPNDPVIPALFIIHKEMQLNNQSNKALAEQVKEATSRISPKVYHFNGEAAWNFQLGITFRWVLGGVLIVLLSLIGFWYWSRKADIDTARIIIDSNGHIGELLKAVRKDDEGSFFIDFTLAKSDSIQHFKEFKKINNKTVRVYLGQESR